eukprot:gb/GEZN01008132.1/.p1 GENE.gb/GEZN01008132.1/~~gb/GEZN01008132.1/.p1  ORF type:complete len:278 (+),score=54.31 gb/GEZN01008132.1/:63-896(+)
MPRVPREFQKLLLLEGLVHYTSRSPPEVSRALLLSDASSFVSSSAWPSSSLPCLPYGLTPRRWTSYCARAEKKKARQKMRRKKKRQTAAEHVKLQAGSATYNEQDLQAEVASETRAALLASLIDASLKAQRTIQVVGSRTVKWEGEGAQPADLVVWLQVIPPRSAQLFAQLSLAATELVYVALQSLCQAVMSSPGNITQMKHLLADLRLFGCLSPILPPPVVVEFKLRKREEGVKLLSCDFFSSCLTVMLICSMNKYQSIHARMLKLTSVGMTAIHK